MSIGELARQTGTSVRMLRHYETNGLLQSSRRANGYREFPASAKETVGHIRTLLACGFSVREIRAFLPCLSTGAAFAEEGCPAGFDQHVAKLREIDGLIDLLQERRRRLVERIGRFGQTSRTIAEAWEGGAET
jgi:DNA-binding transcriptional MerR regulator